MPTFSECIDVSQRCQFPTSIIRTLRNSNCLVGGAGWTGAYAPKSLRITLDIGKYMSQS
jgi:hypothetical protein